MYTTIFFDLDDTLCDTVRNSAETLEDVYNDYQINRFYPTFADFKAVYVPNNEQLWARYSKGEIKKDYLLRERFIFPFRTFDAMTDDEAMAMNTDFLGRVQLKKGMIEGAKEILDYLMPKYKMHIISNGFSEIQYTKLESIEMTSYFDKIILSDTVGVNKPHPDIFTYALRETGAKKEECIMIGDNLFSDINGAFNSGIDQIWFNPANADSGNVTPTHTIQKLEEIRHIL